MSAEWPDIKVECTVSDKQKIPIVISIGFNLKGEHMNIHTTLLGDTVTNQHCDVYNKIDGGQLALVIAKFCDTAYMACWDKYMKVTHQEREDYISVMAKRDKQKAARVPSSRYLEPPIYAPMYRCCGN